MKNQRKDHSSYLVTIRRNKRTNQNNQIMNSIRFNNQINYLIAQDSYQQEIQITQQCLEQLLDHDDLDLVFNSIIKGSTETFQAIQKYMHRIFCTIFQRLSNPKAVLALHNLCIKSDLFVTLILEERKINEIALQLKKLPNGSKQQNIYLSCLCSILEFKQLNQFITMPQFQHLYYHQIQYIVYQRFKDKIEDNLAIRIVKCMIDIGNQQYHFSEEFIIQFLEYFWKANNPINHINIYMSAVSIIKGRVYKRSVTILMSIVKIVLRGRNMLPLNIEEQIPSKIQILLNLFKFYNDNIQKMQTFGIIHVDNLKIQLTLHHFMLQYEIDFFQYRTNQPFLQFLDEFCKNGQSQSIVEKWIKIGLLQQLISHMTQSAQICYLSLKVCLALFARQSSISNSTVGRQMKNLGLNQALEDILQLFYQSKIVSLVLTLIGYLQII